MLTQHQPSWKMLAVITVHTGGDNKKNPFCLSFAWDIYIDNMLAVYDFHSNCHSLFLYVRPELREVHSSDQNITA